MRWRYILEAVLFEIDSDGKLVTKHKIHQRYKRIVSVEYVSIRLARRGYLVVVTEL